ncbi:MAG TPA: hypothetical protein VGL53_01215 [Bryobacteraceae bacterium]
MKGLLADQGGVAELASSGIAGAGRGHSQGDILIDLVLNIGVDFGREIAVAAVSL